MGNWGDRVRMLASLIFPVVASLRAGSVCPRHAQRVGKAASESKPARTPQPMVPALKTRSTSAPNTPSALNTRPARRSGELRTETQATRRNSEPPSSHHGPQRNVYQRSTSRGVPAWIAPLNARTPTTKKRPPCTNKRVPAPQARRSKSQRGTTLPQGWLSASTTTPLMTLMMALSHSAAYT